MKVLFSNPPWWDTAKTALMCGVRAGSRWPHTFPANCWPNQFQFGGYLPYPFFMGYAASYARNALDCEVVMRDSIALREDYDSYFLFVKEMQPDFIVIETSTPSWEHDRSLILALSCVVDSKIILTGIVSQEIEAKHETHGLYAVVRGEYEKGVVSVIKGRYGVIGHDLLSAEEMNAAPFPDMPEDTRFRYCDSNPVGQVFPHAQVWSSRGCPFKCIYCVWPATMTGNDPDGKGVRKVRYYTPEYMESYLQYLKELGFKSVYFDDDTFNLGDKHTLAMCGVMRKIGLPWSAMCRADTVKRETWKEMKDSGCFGVKIGFESGSQWVIDHIVNKRLNINEAAENARYLREIGMTVHGTFTIGLPGETAAQKQETLDLIKTLPLTSHQLSGCAEIDGTPLANLHKSGHLEAYDGATLDGNYSAQSDGAKKARES